MIVLSEVHLRRILTKYSAYYNEWRTHRSLNKYAPIHRAIHYAGNILSMPVLGGLSINVNCQSRITDGTLLGIFCPGNYNLHLLAQSTLQNWDGAAWQMFHVHY
jgi:hypothetical protein